MPDQGIKQSGTFLDLSSRFNVSQAIVGSPAAAAETVVAQLTIALDIAIMQGVWLMGWLAYTIGATPTSCRARVRRTNVAGTVVADTGAMTGGHNTAAQLVADDVNALDTGATLPGQTYVLTLQVVGGSSASTVSAAWLAAVVI